MSGKIYLLQSSRANACIASSLTEACEGPALDDARETYDLFALSHRRHHTRIIENGRKRLEAWGMSYMI